VPKNVIIQKVGGMQSTPVMVKLYFYATKTNLPSGRQTVDSRTQQQQQQLNSSILFISIPNF
jgi:hypothetical protein